MRPGFTFVEVVVALVVLEIGLLGAMGVLIEASRTSRRAATLEVGVAAVQGIADSLLVVGWSGDGRSSAEAGELSWTSEADSSVLIVFEPVGGRRDAIRIRLLPGTLR